MAQNAQDPYSGMSGDEQTPETTQNPLTFTIQEQPEYLKAMTKQATTYNPATNSLTRLMSQSPAPLPQPTPTPTATGSQPWLNDAGYKAMAPEQQTQFNALMQEMEGYQKSSREAGFTDIGLSQGAGEGKDFWEQWYPKQVELEDKWGWMKPVTEVRDPLTGLMTGYQSITGKYDYLQPGQYAKTLDQAGKEIYYYKDPMGKTPGLLSSPTEPQGMYDVEKADLYGVSETNVNPKTMWDQFAATYKYGDMPGLGTLPQETQNQISPYLTQVTDIQTKISDLQNMRPEERYAKEQETGQSLTSYLSNLQDVQKQMASALEGTDVTIPQFNPVTGEKVGPEQSAYNEQVEAQRQLSDMFAQPYMTGPTEQQGINSLALDLLMQAYSNPYQQGQYNYYQPTGYSQLPNIGTAGYQYY